MSEILFHQLPLAEKAAFVQEKGQFIEAQDFYSFFILVYLLDKHHIKLVYDFSGLVVGIEDEKDTAETFITGQLESSLDTLD